MACKGMAQNAKLQRTLIHRKCIYVSTMITSQVDYFQRVEPRCRLLTHFD